MKDTFDFMALGQAIKKAREAKGMTREQLAEILGVAPRHLQSIEKRRAIPEFSAICPSCYDVQHISRSISVYGRAG